MQTFFGLNKKLIYPYFKIITLFLLMVPLVVIIEIFGPLKGTIGDFYSVFGAPPVEEAFKALMLVVLIMISFRKPLKRLDSKLTWFLGGFGTGLLFGLYEDLTAYSFYAERIVPTLNHCVWTGIVGLGICFYVRSRVETKLLLPYLAVVISHALWNYGGIMFRAGANLIFLAVGVASWIISLKVLIFLSCQKVRY